MDLERQQESHGGVEVLSAEINQLTICDWAQKCHEMKKPVRVIRGSPPDRMRDTMA